MLRHKNWAYLSPSEGLPFWSNVQIETGCSKDPLLYNMDYDIGQQQNLAWEYPEVVNDMEKRIQKILHSNFTR